MDPTLEALLHGGKTAETSVDDLWTPFEGPQMLALDSPAHELYYGGSAGGGKSDLLVGAALTRHQKSIIYRREFPQFRDLIMRANEILAPINVQYVQNQNWWWLPDGRVIELGSVPSERDLMKYRGRPHDLIGFDEGTEFPQYFVRFLTAWNRSSDPNQHCRVILAGNPPQTEEGEWVIRYWSPWLDERHPNPAEPGELRWFVYADDESQEVDGPDPVHFDGRDLIPRSRTFIPARLEDNPVLMATNYMSLLMGLPEELRVRLLDGKFILSTDWSAFQVIPRPWVLLAQDRWEEPDTRNIPDSTGIDPARGGDDRTALAFLYGDNFVTRTHPGKRTPDGPAVAHYVLKELEPYGEAIFDIPIGVDKIGAGGSVIDVLKANGFKRVMGIHASGKSRTRALSPKLPFANIRAQYHFRFREALDPLGGVPLGIPPRTELAADLCAPRYKPTVRGLQVEDKDEIRKRIQRSPDEGEAILLCWHARHYTTTLSMMTLEDW